jgi:hypothetical protein
MRGRVAVAMILVGLVLMVVSYFWWGGAVGNAAERAGVQQPAGALLVGYLHRWGYADLSRSRPLRAAAR